MKVKDAMLRGMKYLHMIVHSNRKVWRPAALLSLALGLMLVPGAFSGEDLIAGSVPHIQAYQPGEILKYDISWSNIITAGTAVLEVKQETLPDGKEVLKFSVEGHSTGLVDKFIHVTDMAQSVFDPVAMQSLEYSLSENYGKKSRRREMVFDPVRRTVISKLNEDQPETFTVPDRVLDALSAFYRIRTLDDFNAGKGSAIDVHDSGKNWSVEIQTLGREKVRTSMGEFSTIKVRTYPRYEGVFMNKGEVYLWLTDDSRKIPVLVKSRLAVGSFVLTLTDIRPGAEAH
jgi:hypothetical protein